MFKEGGGLDWVWERVYTTPGYGSYDRDLPAPALVASRAFVRNLIVAGWT
jgi:hypothetical protein